MSASTKILSFTDTNSVAQKITAVTVFRIVDFTDNRTIQTFKPTKQYKATDSLATLKTEAGSLFSATENGLDILLNSITIVRIEANGSGCNIFYQGGERVSVSEDIDTIEGRIDEVATGGSPVNWKANYVSGDSYAKNDMTLDSGWLMVANTDTVERPAPQPSGDPTYGLPTSPTWTELSNTSVIYSGHYYTFTKSGWVQGIRVWIPEVTSDTNYRFILVRNPLTTPVTTIIEEPVLNANEWTTLALGNVIVTEGENLLFYIDALNSGSSSPTTGGWTFQGRTQSGAPNAQSWVIDNQNALLRIDKTDLDSVNRGTELLGITAGSTIRFSDSTAPAIFLEYLTTADPTDQGTYVEYSTVLVNSGGTLSTGTTDMDAATPVPQATKFDTIDGYYPANYPDFATVQGLLQYDGVTQPNNTDNAFGVDLQFQEASISEEWDLASYMGGAGSSRGSSDGRNTLVSRVVELSADDSLLVDTYYRISGGTTYTLPTASTFVATSPNLIFIKNISGASITVQPDGSDTIFSNSAISSFQLASGDAVILFLASTTQWDIN